MRYDAEHKKSSRERILDSAAKQFRKKGSEVVRVSDVMRAAGMTHGGFYRHFEDKDQLLEQAIETALFQISNQIAEMTRGLPRGEALKRTIAFYLSEEHLLHPDLGCALAALGSEMTRLPSRIKAELSKSLDAYSERLDHLMPGETKEQQRSAFFVLFPSMAGCLITARAHSSRERQRQILAGGRAFFTHAFCGEISVLDREA